jgi:hypothetical protein
MATTVTFRTTQELEEAFKPFSVEEVSKRLCQTPFRVEFKCDASLPRRLTVPLRNMSVGGLLNTTVYKTETLTVFYPASPRVPHHLTIVLNRRDIKGIADVSEEENREIFATIKKIAEIYHTIAIKGFVIAQFDTPQVNHFGRFVVEIIPHLPGFEEVKNVVDKVDCNRYVLFRSANLSSITYRMETEEIQRQARFWQTAFIGQTTPLSNAVTTVRKDAYQVEAEKISYHWLLELLQDKGGEISDQSSFEAVMPTECPKEVAEKSVASCFFL